MPSGNPDISDYSKEILTDWVKQGGTLIANNRSARLLASSGEFGDVKLLQQSFDDSKSYNIDLMREIYSLDKNLNKSDINSNRVNFNIDYPWESSD